MSVQRKRSISITRFWALGFLALLLSSTSLWLPAAWLPAAWLPATEYPTVEMNATLGSVDVLFRFIGPLVMVVSCGVIGCWDADSPRHQRWRAFGWVAIVFMLTVGFAADQHRLQPWAYQMWLYGLILICLGREESLPFLRINTASIYLFSSIGKFDFQFIHTVGQEFLNTAGSFLGLEPSTWDESLRNRFVLLFPGTELVIGVLCLIRKTRFWGGVMAIAMHAGLIALLSPWGMGHSPGVIIWNVVLAGQAYLLFVRPSVLKLPEPAEPGAPHHIRRSVRRYGVATLLVVAAILLPLTERRGQGDPRQGDPRQGDPWRGPDGAALSWDHWLSWALYSPHNSRFYMEVRPRELDDLPRSIQLALGPDTDGDGWRVFDLDQFSLQCRGVPVLPQARYQLQLAIKIAHQQGWNQSVRGVLRSASDRRTGRRNEKWLVNLTEMQTAANQFWLGPDSPRRRE